MEKIIRIINEWNPIDIHPLLEDEYYSESAKVFEAANRSESIEALGKELHYIFIQSFGKEFTKSIEECGEIALKIFNSKS